MKYGAARVALWCFLAASFVYGFTDVFGELEQQQAQFSTIQFNFSQKVMVQSTKETVYTKGTIWFKKPQSIRVEQNVPHKQYIIANATTTWLYNVREKQVIVSPGLTSDTIRTVFPWWNIIFEARDVQKIYQNISITDEEEHYVMRMQENNDAMYTIYIGKTPVFPYKIEIRRPDLEVTLELSEMQYNQTLPDTLFALSIPKGVQVLEEKQ